MKILILQNMSLGNFYGNIHVVNCCISVLSKVVKKSISIVWNVMKRNGWRWDELRWKEMKGRKWDDLRWKEGNKMRGDERKEMRWVEMKGRKWDERRWKEMKGRRWDDRKEMRRDGLLRKDREHQGQID